MTRPINASSGSPHPGRFTCRIAGRSYYVATPGEIGATGPSQRLWVESRASNQNAKAEPFFIELNDLSQGAGFSYSYDKLPQVYAFSAGFDAWAPGIISTRAKLTTGATFSTGSDLRGWQFTLGGYLYCARGRYVGKYKITSDATQWALVATHDLEVLGGAGAVCAGRPEVFKGKAYVPIQVAGIIGRFHELTTVDATTDTWTRGPAAIYAKWFRAYLNRLAKGQGDASAPTDNDRVYFCEADPMTAGNWSPTSSGTGYEFGQNQFQVTDAVEYTPYLVVGKENSMQTLDDSYQSHSAVQDFDRFSDPGNFIGMEVAQGEVCAPSKAGLILWDGSSYDVVGIGQEGFFNPGIDRGDGRFYSLAPAGELCYYVANDIYGGYAILGSFKNPEPRRFTYGTPTRTKVWQTYEIESGGVRYENVIVLSTAAQAVSPKTPATWSDSNAVGTVAWTNPSNAAVLDGAYAQAVNATGAAITSHYLKGLGPPVLVPTGATITGVQVDVAKSSVGVPGGGPISADAASGQIQSTNAAYATARSGGTLTTQAMSLTAAVGQWLFGGSYLCWEGFVSFDTSPIPDGATIISAVLSLTTTGIITPVPYTPWTLQARTYDWGATLTTADYVAGASLSGDTLVASAAIAADPAAAGVTLTSTVDILAAINKTGTTRLVLCSASMVAGTAPTASEFLNFTGASLLITYSSSVDATVKLVIAGSVTGSNLADTSTNWPSSAANYVTYGGATTTWGGLPTVAQANDAANFGVVISATVGPRETVSIDHVRMTVYYTVAGQTDTASLLSVLKVDATGLVAQPIIYQLPRNAVRSAYDPQLLSARDNAIFQTSRYHEPGRHVQKVFGQVEFYCEMSASNGTGPSFNVMYSYDDTHWDYLLASQGGAVLEVGAALGTASSGKVIGYFPRTGTSWTYANHNTVALRFVLATKTGAQVDTSVVIRDTTIVGWYRPTRGGDFQLTLSLGALETQDGLIIMRSVQQQLADLRSYAEAASYPVTYQSPDGRTGYIIVDGVEFREGQLQDAKGASWPSYVCTLHGEWVTG